MRQLLAYAVTGLVLAALTAAARADEKEEKIPLDKLPKAVRKAVKARFPEAKLLGAEKENENGKILYEVALKDKGHKLEATFTPNGKLVSIEKVIAAKELPKAAADAVKAKYAGAKWKVVEEVTKVKDGEEKLAFYEVHLTTADGQRVEVEVGADGRILNTEVQGKKKADKD